MHSTTRLQGIHTTAHEGVNVVVVVVVHLKRLRMVPRCAKAGCGRRTSSS